ncbi:AAA family ATPase [Streptomyces sp. NPDC001890]|uniref:AAA family ATPase n=1 Tax=Streptomyces sp. NPDC001890 TaxID=3364620 RepID=UPI003686D53A
MHEGEETGAKPGAQGFDVYTVPLGEYLSEEKVAADEEACAIGAILEPLGGALVPWEVKPKERDLGRVFTRLRGWSTPVELRNSLLLWVGHGWSNGRKAALYVRGHDPDTDDAELPPEAFAIHVAEARRQRSSDGLWDIVVVEACGAGLFVRKALSCLSDGEESATRGLLLVGSGRDEGEGHLGTFRRTLEHVLTHSYSDHDTVIPLHDLGTRLDETRTLFVAQLNLGSLPPLRRRTAFPVTASVEIHARLREAVNALPEADRAHFARKGLGSEFGEVSWGFAGRTEDRAAIADWLAEHRSGLLIVTGRAGCGKSALLGNVLLHANARLGKLLPLLSRTGLAADPIDMNPELPAFDLTLHLTGATAHDVTARLAAALGAQLRPDVRPPVDEFNDLIAALRSGPTHHKRPYTLLVDALDEAQEPPLLAELLRELGTLPNIRLVVGARPSLYEALDRAPSADHDLLDALGAAEDHVSVHWLRRDAQALDGYVARSLEQARASYPGRPETFPDAVRRACALIVGGTEGDTTDNTQDRDFLYAGLAVHEILADPGLLLADRARELAVLLRGDHRSLFSTAVRRLSARHARAGQLLEALAHTQGRGLPRADRIWATTAAALGCTGQQTVSSDDIDEILKAAAPYIMLDGEDGQSVHRLAHRTFAEHFTGAHGSAAYGTSDVGERQRRVAEGLVRLADEGPGQPLNPYLARHLSSHAAAAGILGWTALAGRPSVLDRLSVKAVATDVLRAVGESRGLPPSVLGVLDAAHLLRRCGPADRVGLRQFGTARAAGVAPIREEPANAGRGAGWQVCWARLRPRPPRLTLARRPLPVRSLTPVTGPGGSTLLAGVDDSGGLQVWDPARGYAAAAAEPFAKGPVTAVTSIPGTTLLATSGHDKRIRIWDVSSGRPRLCRVAENGMWPHTLHGCLLPAGAGDLVCSHGSQDSGGSAAVPLVAVGEYGGGIRFLDPMTGQVRRPWFRSHDSGPVRALTTFQNGGGTLLASAAGDGVRVWDARTGQRVGPLVRRADATARAVAAFNRPDGGGTLLAGGWDDGGVQVWEPVSGEPVTEFRSDGPVNALTVLAAADGCRPLLAAVARSGAARVWDALTGRAEALTDRAPLAPGPHARCAQGLAITAFEGPAGDTLLASAADDGTVSVWNPYLPQEPGTIPGPRSATATAANAAVTATDADPSADRIERLSTTGGPDGATLLLAEDYGGRLAAFDVTTGEPTAVPQGHHPAGPPTGTTRLSGPGGLPLRATYRRSEDIQLTVEATGRPYGGLLTGHQDWVTDVVEFTAPDGRLLLASCGDGDDRTVRFWDPDPAGRRTPLYTLSLEIQCRSLAALGDGRIAIGTDEGLLVIRMESWLLTGQTEGGRDVRSRKGH